MRNSILLPTIAVLSVSLAAAAAARPSYIGYSGAPGSRGTCSISCHHVRDFAPSISVSGFPENYVPEQQYVITVSRTTGSAITQFNASVRVGDGSINAGTISPGTGTATYNHANETNGVHWSSPNRTSGTFLWTAPAAGTGPVRLYLAGLQGSLSSGADTLITLVANESATDIRETAEIPHVFAVPVNYPNPFNSRTSIAFQLEKDADIKLEIFDITGRKIDVLYDGTAAAGKHTFVWNAADRPSGIYFYRLCGDIAPSMGKMILLR